MHIEPGIVNGAKIALSFATAAGAAGFTAKYAWAAIKESGVSALASRVILATIAVFTFFQVLPHYPVGVSEVHFILGSTLFLMFGAAPAAIGLALGLLAQGVFFAPFDLPMYFINVTTLLVPLFAVKAIADRVIAPTTAYVDIKYKDALLLSTAFQGGVVAWVAFWAFYGQGFGATNVASVMSFSGAYLLVIIIEPLVDLAVLAFAKTFRDFTKGPLFTARLHNAG